MKIGKSKLNKVQSTFLKEKSHQNTFSFQDKRPEAVAQRHVQEMVNASIEKNVPIQTKANNTGLPNQLKSGIENLSGYSMDDVKVHYNSPKPAQLHAHAYAQGTDIHIASGQEKHLPHEAWHVVQQKQGRVKPTMQLKGAVNINDDAGLEKEADVMGGKALQLMDTQLAEFNLKSNPNQNLKQRRITDIKPTQRMMKKLGFDKDKYRKATMTTVFLYAEFNGKPVGCFNTQKGNHAEENLIEFLIKQGFKDGNLVVYLSTSPCSSVFCTRGDGKEGCQERLSRLQSERNIMVTVHADHLYQPQALVSQEAEFGSKGFSSYSSAATSDFKMTFSSLPNKLKSPDMMDDFKQPVAQL